MKKPALVAILILTATALQAQTSSRRTVFIRDGNVIADDGRPHARRAFLGIAVTELTPELREFFGAPKDAGVLVSSVSASTPAGKAGLRVGDIVTAANGQPVSCHRDLVMALKDKHAGDAVRLEVIRGRAHQTLVATAEERSLPEMTHLFKLDDLPLDFGKHFEGKEWRAMMASPENADLQARIHDLETRLRDLEKRLADK